jgi:cytochrome c oxidase cbb3-type subunit 3
MPSLWTQNAGINEASVSPKSDLITEYLPWVLLATAIALAIVILFMGVLLSRVAILKGSLKTSKNVLALLVLISANSLSASNANQGAPFFTVTVLNYLLIAVILLEVLIILYFANWLKAVILPAKKKSKTKTSAIVSWWNKANKSVAIENEKDVQLDHDYDGIKELDNALPPWWVYGFYLTIVFSAIYVWRYHIGKSAPLQVQELKMAIAAAEIQQAEYDKRNANKVDENTIVYKEDPVLIENGKALFAKNCAACHGQEAGGGTGPNLTDNYWKHGGDIKNVFKTIRYGVPDMGMIAWGDILTPVEIGSLATFIKSIKGSNPINPKEPEGQLEEESTIEEESAEIEKVLSAL